MSTVIKVENLGKHYNLGNIGSYTMRDDMAKLWAKLSGKEYHSHKIGESSNQNSFWALQDVNFEVQQGEVLGVIGKNGAGKSTLLKILSKVTAPTCGQIKIKGRIASLLEVGTGFHPELTGRENVFMNGAILGMTKREIASKFDEIVDFSGIAQFIDTPVKRYSSGMYVRLAFAVAAHLEPEILIVDEVLAVGDAEFQKKCLGKMKDVSGQGRTVLFVSHNMAAIQNLCTNCIVLSKGMLINKAPVNESILFYNNLNNAASQTTTALKERTDRQGNSAVKFSHIRYFNTDNREIFIINSVQAFFIEFEFEINDKAIKNLYISCDIKNKENLTIFHLDNLTKDGIVFKLSGPVINNTGKIRCFIPQLPLPDGKYSLDIFCSDTDVVYDSVLNAGTLEVEEGDFFGSGFALSSQYGLAFLQHNWSLAI